MNNKKLATKIASRILKMNNPNAKEAGRVALMFGKWPDKEFSKGGKNKACLIEEIEEILDEHNSRNALRSDMKNLSNEVIIYKLIGAVENEIGQALHPIDDNHVIWAYKAELLSRLNRLAEAESQLEKLKYTVRLASTWLGEYINDSDNATHAKRILQNEIISWQPDGLTQGERK